MFQAIMDGSRWCMQVAEDLLDLVPGPPMIGTLGTPSQELTELFGRYVVGMQPRKPGTRLSEEHVVGGMTRDRCPGIDANL
jgi:hypothetical protein